jgi:Zn-dependent protease with chaperone function
MFTLVAVSTNQILSITGIICLTGLAIGGIYALTTLAAGDWVASKLLHVINLNSNEYDWLQTEVASISKKLGISTPQVGLVEDLRPNAFTMGVGRKTKLVFTLGLLNILNKEEILAVAFHELAHIKNHDYFFKTFSNALTAVSFFNPLAYFALFNSQREREMLADENGAKLLQKPECLSEALTKITKALQNLPREAPLIRLTSNLLVSSPIIHRPQILSSHPKIDLRLRNISQLTVGKPRKLKPSKLLVAIMFTCVIIVAGVTTTYALANFQSGYVSSKIALTPSAYVKGVSTDSLGTHIILISSNLTFSPTTSQIYSFQNPNQQITSPYNPASLSIVPHFNQNQPEYLPPQTSIASPGTVPSNIMPIIYTVTSGNRTTLIFKY